MISNKKTIQIIILLIIAVILAIILCLLHIMDTLKDNKIIQDVTISINNDVKENPKAYKIEEILESYGCKGISYSVETDDDKRFYQIFLNFRYKLYENNISQEEYFNNIIKSLKEKIDISFNLVDNSKSIDIYYDSKENIVTINGIEDYFNNNSYIKVNSHKTTEPIKAVRSSTALNMVLTNDWNRYNLKIKDEPISIDEEFINYEGYKLNYSDITINYIIFSEDYESTILFDLKAGDDFQKIMEKLGQPTYKDSTDMIGYKTVDGYVFFYEDFAVLYPRKNYINLSFEELILSYYNDEYNGYRTNFVREVLEQYKDFESEIIEDCVKLTSPSRGIDIYLYDDGETKISIYDNYALCAPFKILAETNKIELKYDIDSIYQFEQERNSK